MDKERGSAPLYISVYHITKGARAGRWIIDAALSDKDKAVAWAKACAVQNGTMEQRPFATLVLQIPKSAAQGLEANGGCTEDEMDVICSENRVIFSQHALERPERHNVTGTKSGLCRHITPAKTATYAPSVSGARRPAPLRAIS